MDKNIKKKEPKFEIYNLDHNEDYSVAYSCYGCNFLEETIIFEDYTHFSDEELHNKKILI